MVDAGIPRRQLVIPVGSGLMWLEAGLELGCLVMHLSVRDRDQILLGWRAAEHGRSESSSNPLLGYFGSVQLRPVVVSRPQFHA